MASSNVLLIESVQQAASVLKPLRIQMLRQMTEPRTCTELAREFGVSPQKAYYHVKSMERAGVVERSAERIVNGLKEGFYRARARSFWLSPRLVKSLGGTRAARDQTSLGMLARTAEQVLEDVGHLAERSTAGEEVSSLSLDVSIDLPDPERRQAFMQDLTDTFQALASRYTDSTCSTPASGQRYRFTLLCYPKSDQEIS